MIWWLYDYDSYLLSLCSDPLLDFQTNLALGTGCSLDSFWSFDDEDEELLFDFDDFEDFEDFDF